MSIAWAITPDCSATAAATLASSELISATISAAVSPSRSSEAGFRASVVKCSSIDKQRLFQVVKSLDECPAKVSFYAAAVLQSSRVAQNRYRTALPGLLA